MAGELEIHIIAAINLPNMDSNPVTAKKSDPYVVVQILNARRRTSVISNNLNPVWVGPEIMYLGIKASVRSGQGGRAGDTPAWVRRRG